MTNWFSGNRRRLAEEAASMWLERLERTLQSGESQQLRDWLKMRRHREIILKKCTNWHGPEILAILGKLMPVDVMSARAVRRAKWSRTVSAAFLAFCLVGLCTVLMMGWAPWSRSMVPRPHPGSLNKTYQTAVNARQHVMLPDGSTIVLNTATQLAVDYDPQLRAVSLIAGEATFMIASAPDRPFRLTVGKRHIQTESGGFNIRLLTPEKFDIAVDVGQVTILSTYLRARRTPADLRNAFNYGEITLHSPQGAVVESDRQTLRELKPVQMEAQFAWQRGIIVLTDQPLEIALAEIARYTENTFVLSNERLRRLRLSGEFRTGDVDSVLRALHETFLIEAQSDGTGRIVLAAAAED